MRWRGSSSRDAGAEEAILTSPAARLPDRAQPDAGPVVTAVAVLVALGCLAFALVNVVFELNDRFAEGSYAEYASALAVMNWLVVGLKLLGGAVALLSVAPRQRLVSIHVMTLLLWGAFATLSVYSLGSVVQAVGMMTGMTGNVDQIDGAGVAYVVGSVCFAAGFGALAIAYGRRHGFRSGAIVGGVLGAPALLALLLLAIPALLAAAGLMPSA
jgi:hypothetical protein